MGAERLTVAGLGIELLAILLMSLLGLGSSPLAVAGCLALFGIGGGVFGSPNTKLIMSHAPKDKLGIAGSINALARNMGMVTGIAFAVSILYGAMSAALGMKVEGFVPDHPEAFIAGMRAVFLAAAALLLVSIMLTLARARRREEA
jgi:predicted MFS family arabinose efflux permease